MAQNTEVLSEFVREGAARAEQALIDLERERQERSKEWVLKTPYGPMVHRDTGETYQAMGARLEYEYQRGLAA